MWRLYKGKKTNAMLSKYKTAAKQYSECVDKYTSQYEEKFIKDGKLRSFFKYINNKINGSTGSLETLNGDPNPNPNPKFMMT